MRPREGGLRPPPGRKFLVPPTTASAQCLRLSERFFSLTLVFVYINSVLVFGILNKTLRVRLEAAIVYNHHCHLSARKADTHLPSHEG